MSRIIQIFSQWLRPKAGDRRRHSDAVASWHHAHRTAGDWVLVPVDEVDCRNAKSIGDKKPIPFLRSIIDVGLEQSHAQPSDTLFFINDDVHMAEDIGNDIATHPLSYASRRDFMAVPRRCTKASLSKGQNHPGLDAFSCPVALWPKIRREMPDMFIARSRFDLVLRSVLKRNGAVEIYNALGHVLHPQDWIASEEEPAGKWNIDLFWKYEAEVEKLWDF